MRYNLRILSLLVPLLLAGTLHAQESSKGMTTQFGLSLLLGLGDYEFTGGEFRGFIPISSVEGLRIIPALGFSVNNINDHSFVASASVAGAYTPYRFAGRNGGAYVKAGPRYDVGFNTDIENSTDGNLAANIGVGVQGSLGPIDLYGEFEHLFLKNEGANQIIIGLTIAAQ